jgi:Protein of unknown function (DUF1579)
MNSPPSEGAPTPTPEMQRLAALLVGTWDMTLTYAPGPLAPEGGTGTGQETSRPGPGGLSLFIETTAGGPAGQYEAGGIIEWSATQQVYKLHWLSSLSHVGSYFDGTWVEEDLVFNGTENLMGQAFASRHTITNIRTDAFLYTIDIGATHDQLERTITIDYTKRPEAQDE